MRNKYKILIMGLSGAGKTTLATSLAPKLTAVHFNADDVRANVSKDLGFSIADRLEQSRRMRWLCDRVVNAGHVAIADFICPTQEARDVFGPAFVIWVDRIQTCRFEDTNKVFEPPTEFDVRVSSKGGVEEWVDHIMHCWEKI